MIEISKGVILLIASDIRYFGDIYLKYCDILNLGPIDLVDYLVGIIGIVSEGRYLGLNCGRIFLFHIFLGFGCKDESKNDHI